jgi:hypothetical protein
MQNLNISFDQHFIDINLANKLLNQCHYFFKNDDTFRSSMLFGDAGLIYTVTYKNKLSKYTSTSWDVFPDLLIVKNKIEEITKEHYNFCAIMRYANGNVVIKKHRDKEIPKESQICGLSLGATRQFQLTSIKNVNQTYKLTLNHGSLYCLLPPTNNYWLHEILPDPDCTDVRYSLTFRNINNALTVNDIKYCQAFIKTGPRRGQYCHCNINNLTDIYCGKHKK